MKIPPPLEIPEAGHLCPENQSSRPRTTERHIRNPMPNLYVSLLILQLSRCFPCIHSDNTRTDHLRLPVSCRTGVHQQVQILSGHRSYQNSYKSSPEFLHNASRLLPCRLMYIELNDHCLHNHKNYYPQYTSFQISPDRLFTMFLFHIKSTRSYKLAHVSGAQYSSGL